MPYWCYTLSSTGLAEDSGISRARAPLFYREQDPVQEKRIAFAAFLGAMAFHIWTLDVQTGSSVRRNACAVTPSGQACAADSFDSFFGQSSGGRRPSAEFVRESNQSLAELKRGTGNRGSPD